MKVVTIFPVSLVYKNLVTITAQENTQGRGDRSLPLSTAGSRAQGPRPEPDQTCQLALPPNPVLLGGWRSWRTKGGASLPPAGSTGPTLTEADPQPLFPSEPQELRRGWNCLFLHGIS